MNNFVTEISEKDFKKMNLKGYEHVKISCGETSYRMGWKEVSLNEKIDSEKAEWEKYFKDEPRIIAIAIHTNQELALEYEKLWEQSVLQGDLYVRSQLPDNFYYLDKFMNRFSGATTFQIGCGISHLYSTRDYFEIRDDYWRVKKNETEAVYLIHLDD